MPNTTITTTTPEGAARQRAMFGCTIADFMDSVHNSVTFKIQNLTSKPGGRAPAAYAFCAMSILSDAQEEIERGMREEARQSINRAKYLLTIGVIEAEGA